MEQQKELLQHKRRNDQKIELRRQEERDAAEQE